MNFIKHLYNKIKSSYDGFWVEYGAALVEIPPEQREYIDNLLHYNLIGFYTKKYKITGETKWQQ